MKKVIILMVFPLMFLLTACFNDPVQDDLENYLNKEMKKAFELEAVSISAYDQVSGINYTDDWTMYESISKTVIPNYNEFIKVLNQVKIETEELREIHEIYIKGADIQYNAFVKILTALETQDIGLVEDANKMLEEARTLIREYVNKFKSLAKEHDVEWKEDTAESTL